jgi:hypothetical protein
MAVNDELDIDSGLWKHVLYVVTTSGQNMLIVPWTRRHYGRPQHS